MYKVDKYLVRKKGRTYKVLVFPRIEHAWAYDDNPEEDQLMLDGNEEFFTQLKYALAAVIADPSLLIFFPIKKPGCTRFGDYMTYDAVLLRPELQFRRSVWYDIKGKLDRQHYAGKYRITYDEKKLNEWCEKKHIGWNWFMRKAYSKVVEELLGETIFLVLPKDVCYWYHSAISDSLVTFDPTYEYGCYSLIGYLFSDKVLQTQLEEDK